MPPRTLPHLHPFLGRDVPGLVDLQASIRPEQPFTIWEPFEGEPESLTYRGLAEQSRRFAAGLAEHGVARGDFVTIHMDNCLEFLIAWFGCSRLGAVAVTTNTRSTADELTYFLSHSGSVAAITQPRYADLVARSGGSLRWVACTERDGDGQQCARPAKAVAFERLLESSADLSSIRTSVDPLRANSVQYTSGTTSRPKGVVWTHANALWSGYVGATHARLTDRDVHLVYFPLFHTNALAWSMLSTLASGGTMVLQPRFSSSRFWEVSRRHSCTWANMVMFTLQSLLKLPDPPAHSYRFWGCGGDIDVVRERWGIKTIGWFGMTETVSQCIVSEFDEIGPEYSMGRPAREYEIAVRRADGSNVASGETGDLWIRGQPGVSLFREYLKDPDATNAAFDEHGWFDTGDQVVVQPDGNIFYVGRKKDMLKVGGENVAALEVESVIMAVPGVVEAAVVGRDDPMLDEVPVAFVVAEPGAADLEQRIQAACDRDLSDFKRPRDIHFIDTLPKGLLDKVLKKELREMLRRGGDGAATSSGTRGTG